MNVRQWERYPLISFDKRNVLAVNMQSPSIPDTTKVFEDIIHSRIWRTSSNK